MQFETEAVTGHTQKVMRRQCEAVQSQSTQQTSNQLELAATRTKNQNQISQDSDKNFRKFRMSIQPQSHRRMRYDMSLRSQSRYEMLLDNDR